jgi:hypothetical protein
MRSASRFGVLVLLLGVGFLWQRANTRRLDAGIALPPADDAVHLTLEMLASPSSDERRMMLRYGPAADSCAIEFRYVPKALQSDTAFESTWGRLVPLNGAYGAPLLTALALAHGATLVPADGALEPDGIALDIGVLGTDLHAGADSGLIIAGAFSKPPQGPWEVLKLFLPAAGPDGEQPELYLALNRTDGVAIMLPKAPEYWPTLARQLARVLAH